MNINDFKEEYLSGLNEQQLNAVEAVNGSTLLLAVPGSGKTTVLIKRLGYMIYCQNIRPEEILVVTYTVSATNDMKKRYVTFFGEDGYGDKIEFRTINGICAKILLDFGRKYNKNIYDLADEAFINRILIGLYLKYDKEFPSEQDIMALKLAITYAKNMMYSKEDIHEYGKNLPFSFYEIYYDYVAEMQRQGKMDYDDQMVYTYNLLKAYPEVLEYYQNKYKYICVDEAQDTSKIQHAIIQLLTERYHNLLMVADEDQSIYSFRSAVPEYLLQFQKVYKDSKVLLMETNYRSNAEIVNMADDFIQNNELRHPKSMIPFYPKMNKPRFINVNSREEQFDRLLRELKTTTRETAVLYRNNESILPIVDGLERENIPYIVKNADLTIFKHKSILDLRDFTNFAKNPCDTTIFMRIYSKLQLYINKAFAEEVCKISKKTQEPILDVMVHQCKKKNAKDFRVTKILELKAEFNRLNTATSRMGLNIILDLMNYRGYIEEHHLGTGKIDILKILSAKEKTLDDLFNRLDYLQDIIANKEFDKNSNIILTTIHSSKGLEYDNVYLIDVVDGIFPENVPKNLKNMKFDEKKIWEEERRLFYVGITRAKYDINIFDIWHDSAFIEELYQNEKKRKTKHASKEKAQALEQNNDLYNIPFEEFEGLLDKDTIIEHSKYGKGKIINKEKEKIDVLFDGSFVKTTFNLRAVYSLKAIKILAEDE